MIVKHNYQCSFCSSSKTCFVFDEFNMIFAICKDCYEELLKGIPFYEVQDNTCSLCGNTREVKKIEGFDNSMFFTEVFVCDSCLKKMNEAIARH